MSDDVSPPDEFELAVREALHGAFTLEEFQDLRRRYREDGPEAIREAADDLLADDLNDRDRYVDALVDGFTAELDAEDDAADS